MHYNNTYMHAYMNRGRTLSKYSRIPQYIHHKIP